MSMAVNDHQGLQSRRLQKLACSRIASAGACKNFV
jgi:hypothetical protein